MKQKNRTYNNEGKEFLSKLKSKNHPFVIPDGYFEQFDKKLKDRIYKEVHEPEISLSKVRKLSSPQLLAIAASVVILVTIGIIFQWQQNNTNLQDDLTFELIMQEDPDLLLSLDEYTLIEKLAIDQDIELDDFTTYWVDAPFSDQELENLLEMEDFSIDLLYNL